MWVMIEAILIIVGGYLLGSVASAILVCRALGLPDPRSDGSGNPGATNVLRLGGRKAALATLAGDVAKGLVPVLIARGLNQPEWVVGATAVTAFLGHLYPVFFSFKGGKGVATALGVIAGLSWLVFVLTGLTWLLIAWVSRYSSLSSLVSTLLTPLFAWFVTGGELSMVVATAVITAFIFVRHHENIARLRVGAESKIGQKKAPSVPADSPNEAADRPANKTVSEKGTTD
jgi:glycerol-3-phosphate acyltransferase PlsY